MPSGPSVLSETRARQRAAGVSLTNDIDDALKTFSTCIDDVAVKHGQCVHVFSTYDVSFAC